MAPPPRPPPSPRAQSRIPRSRRAKAPIIPTPTPLSALPTSSRNNSSSKFPHPPSAPRPGAYKLPTLKRVIYTGAFAAVAVVGAIYGAGLKAQKEYQEEKQQVVEASYEDRIEYLEQRRAMLVTQKMPLERRLRELRERMRMEEMREVKEGSSSGGEGNVAAGGEK